MKDPYVYEGTNVLINKLNIKDEQKIDEAETSFAILEIDSLRHSSFKINSIFDALLIHKRLFSDIYEWAGKIRSVDIYKGEQLLGGKSIDYVFADYIMTALRDLDKEYQRIEWNNYSSEEKINKICYFVSEFWHIHPFREGNTRTSALFMYFLIKQSGLHINFDFLSKNAKYFRNSLVLSCLYSSSRSEYLLGIVKDATSMKNASSGKYQTIEGFEVNKYSYSSHTMEKIKTISKPQDWLKKGD